MTEQRLSFGQRVELIDEASMEYYNRLQARLLSYDGVKHRLSLRCDSYRVDKKLLAKITIGGYSLKVYLAIDPSQEEILKKKIRFRDSSNYCAYSDVPAMVPVKSDLCVRKLCEIIDIMMAQNGLVKKN